MKYNRDIAIFIQPDEKSNEILISFLLEWHQLIIEHIGEKNE
jgi:hypothetical protein